MCQIVCGNLLYFSYFLYFIWDSKPQGVWKPENMAWLHLNILGCIKNDNFEKKIFKYFTLCPPLVPLCSQDNNALPEVTLNMFDNLVNLNYQVTAFQFKVRIARDNNCFSLARPVILARFKFIPSNLADAHFRLWINSTFCKFLTQWKRKWSNQEPPIAHSLGLNLKIKELYNAGVLGEWLNTSECSESVSSSGSFSLSAI